MSLRKGDNKKQGQKWKNTSAFKIVFDTKAIENHQKVTLDKLCPRCVEVIRWKMTYNKYKKATSESRCVKCQQKNIFKSYRHACDPCAKAHKICAKCLQPTEELSSNPHEEKEKEDRIEHEMEEYLTKLRERTRRTLNRKIQKDLVRWDEEKKHFVEVESGLRLDNLKFKAGLEDEDNVDEADECEEFEAGDFEKKEKGTSDLNGEEKQESNNTETATDGATTIPTEKQPVAEKKPAKTQKEMLALAKQIDFGSDSDGDEGDFDDGNNQIEEDSDEDDI